MLQILVVLLSVLQAHALSSIANSTTPSFAITSNSSSLLQNKAATGISNGTYTATGGSATIVSKEQISTYSAQLFEPISYSVDLPYSVLQVVFAPGIVSSDGVVGGSSTYQSPTSSFEAITSNNEPQLTVSNSAIATSAIASASSSAASQASVKSESAVSAAISNAATSNIITVGVSAPVIAASSLVQSASANPVVYLSASANPGTGAATAAEPVTTFYNSMVTTITGYHFTTVKTQGSTSSSSSSFIYQNSTNTASFATGTGSAIPTLSLVGSDVLVGNATTNSVSSAIAVSSTLSSMIITGDIANTALEANKSTASVITDGLSISTPIIIATPITDQSEVGTGVNSASSSSSFVSTSSVGNVVIKEASTLLSSSSSVIVAAPTAAYSNSTAEALNDTTTSTVAQNAKRDTTENTHPKKLIQTHKFYTNMLLDGQNNTIFTYPYNIFYSTSAIDDPNNQIFAQGLGISIDDVNSRIFTSSDNSVKTNNGDYQTNVDSAPITYSNPTMVAGMILSASEFRSHSLTGTLAVDNQKIMSTTATLALQDGASDNIEFPLFEGQGMVTSIYHGSLTALFSTTSYFSNVQQQDSSISGSIKYIFEVSGTAQWVVYITFPDGNASSNYTLTLSKDLRFVTANMAVDGLIVQTAIMSDNLSSVYDKHAGNYVTDVSLDGVTSTGTSFQYAFDYQTNNNKSDILVYLMPHHVASIDSTTSEYNTGVKIDSPVNGQLTGFNTNKVSFVEQFSGDGDVPTFMPFKDNSTTASYTSSDAQLLQTIIGEEMTFVGSNFTVLTANTDTYTAGKVLAKYAQMLLIAHEVIGDDELTKSIFDPLVEAMSVYVNNNQKYPFYYIEDIGGVSVVGDSDLNYGATYYNDHHFHYGYFINAAAIMGKVSKEINSDWLDNSVKNWVNLLIMDVANPNADDLYFPQYRMFDWYHGHSFASGLFSSGDGRNQESSSEDVNFVYGMKLWADVIEDESLLADANLMLLIMKRSLNTYYFFDSSSENIPECYTPHMVPGILFENKLTYVTFFGTDVKYIHGIQMLPITPASILIKDKTFVETEWDNFSMDTASADNDPWSHILKLNQALFNGEESYEHFSEAGFSLSQLDDGQSLTWSLAFSIAMK